METVTTYMNGHGVWHAEIDFPGPYGSHFLDKNIDRIRAKARRAIRREILARQNGPIAPVRVEVVSNHLNSLNQMLSITYAERY